MKIENASARVETPRTTKPATGTGKPKAESTEKSADARAVAEETRAKKAQDPVQQQVKKMQSVDALA